MNNPNSKSPVIVCALILCLTIATKALALINGTGLLTQPHPFLPGSFEFYIWLAMLIELAVLGTLMIAGARAFLALCFGLSLLFIVYHTLEVALQIKSPCPCMGGILSRWKPLTQAES